MVVAARGLLLRGVSLATGTVTASMIDLKIAAVVSLSKETVVFGMGAASEPTVRVKTGALDVGAAVEPAARGE